MLNRLKELFHIISKIALKQFFWFYIEKCEQSKTNLYVQGWAFNLIVPIDNISIHYNRQHLGTIYNIVERPDVQASYFVPNSLRSGFAGTIPVDKNVAEIEFHFQIKNWSAITIKSPVNEIVPITNQHPNVEDAAIEVVPKSHPRLDKRRNLLSETIVEYCRSIGQKMVVLNWHPHAFLEPEQEYIIFEMFNSAETEDLPYFDNSIDITVIPFGNQYMREAKRVTKHVVLQVDIDIHDNINDINIIKLNENFEIKLPKVSVIFFGTTENTDTYIANFQQLDDIKFIDDIIIVSNTNLSNSDIPHSPSLVEAIKRANSELIALIRMEGEVQDKAIASMLSLLYQHNDIGVIFPKVLTQNGILQEAGCNVMEDGDIYPFGYNAPNPDSEPYQHIRQIYCGTGYFFLSKRKLLEKYADETLVTYPRHASALFCLQVLEKEALRTVYQPLSNYHLKYPVLIETSYAIRRNLVSFIHNSNLQFFNHVKPDPLVTLFYFSTFSPKQLRALVCSTMFPDYDRQGGSLHIFYFVQFLLEANYSVTFLADQDISGDTYRNELQNMGVCCFYSNQTDWHKLIQGNQFDIALLCYWDISAKYEPIIRALSPKTKVLANAEDVHFLRQARIIKLNKDQKRDIFTSQFAQDTALELNTYANSDLLLTISDKEKNFLSEFMPSNKHIESMPLICDFQMSTTPFNQRSGFLILGNYYHEPNILALKWFINDILPLIDVNILHNDPIYIVGNQIQRVQHLLKDLPDHIKIIGWVPSIEPYLSSTKALIAPINAGAGSRTKIIQAMMSGLPVISTTLGAEGIDITHLQNILIADDAAQFVEMMRCLTNDEKLWNRLHANGNILVNKIYHRNTVKDKFLSAINRVLQDD